MNYDYIIVGAGMSGLTVGSLLAKAGKRVCILEAHEYPGGCCHSFKKGEYTFCASVHYIFFAGEGQPVHNFLKKLGLEKEITFERLDPEGYDIFSCPTEGLRCAIPNGLENWRDRLIANFPEDQKALSLFFKIIFNLVKDFYHMPYDISIIGLMKLAYKTPSIFKFRKWTLQDLFNHCGLSLRVQAVLATQLGDVAEPPKHISLIIYAALIWSYGRGAYYPTKHFHTFIDTIANTIETSPGSKIHYNTEIVKVEREGHQISKVISKSGECFQAPVIICNMDPQKFVKMMDQNDLPTSFSKRVDYDYSVSALTLFLGVQGLNLRDYGFGKGNIWHYPHLDINRIYEGQHEKRNLSDPWFFMSTPTLYSPASEPRIAPRGEEILEVVTTCPYELFRQKLNESHQAYVLFKNEIRDRILDLIEAHYIPNFKEHVVLKVVGTPTTHERYLWAPHGNIYGSALTPKNVDFSRLKFRSPIKNLFFTGATVEFPGIGATVMAGTRLYTYLTNDVVHPGKNFNDLI
ncbi:MAG: NAD(P)/FAD-dependent oxidoreductase [Deltaproteobacteria bacterium]|nr:NAD(P)/FAD-dependent oxidoreductase [Deltaproteobacteria bacterium]